MGGVTGQSRVCLVVRGMVSVLTKGNPREIGAGGGVRIISNMWSTAPKRMSRPSRVSVEGWVRSKILRRQDKSQPTERRVVQACRPPIIG